jgi:dihydroneopterin aldolase
MADTLHVHDIAVECRLGVYDWEREAPQTVWVDLELAVDAARAAQRDDVRSSVDYAGLVTSVQGLAQSRPHRLLETLAEEIASLVLRESGSPWVRVQVRKRALPGIGYAAVTVERAAARRRTARPPTKDFGGGARRGLRARARLAKALRR